ncbi:3,4-dihydroxy-2-butanone-4-phosphate synthase [Patescibacteria group bacterium]|nr:3,4-dihydroxy-2-butanone-4-phosphate synthase [Patescibacteria group bacterium]
MNTIPEAVDAFAKGETIVVVDDKDRENEGDLVCAAEDITPEKVNFMLTFGRGLICAPLSNKFVQRLMLPQMVESNTEKLQTAFTVSLDAKEKTTTGISASDRAHTLKMLSEKNAGPEDFVYPGHIFPLRANEGGVCTRPGHTEAAIDLTKLANKNEAAAICEILSVDGSMARRDALLQLASDHALKIITIEDLIYYLG